MSDFNDGLDSLAPDQQSTYLRRLQRRGRARQRRESEIVVLHEALHAPLQPHEADILADQLRHFANKARVEPPGPPRPSSGLRFHVTGTYGADTGEPLVCLGIIEADTGKMHPVTFTADSAEEFGNGMLRTAAWARQSPAAADGG